LTDQLIHSKITQLQYDEELSECQREFLSISDQNFNQENNSFRNNPSSNDGESNKLFDKNGLLYANVNLESENIKVGSILPQQEFRFMFLRFWTLYDSMYHSNYIVSKMRLWQELGKKELSKFFAMLGIPPNEYEQQYRFMSHKYKENLKNKIMEIAPKFDLENILYPSFIRQIDNKTQLNAADMVYAVTSLLESPQAVMIEDIPDHEKVEEPEKETAKEPEVIDLQHIREIQVENFWAAYKSLNTKNKSYLESGIFLAKKLQKSLMYQ
jgi:cell division control protein 45